MNRKNLKFENLKKLNYYICDEPRGLILGSLLFILYLNDSCFLPQYLKPIVFADDTNSFCSNKEKHHFFGSKCVTWKNI